MKRFTQKLLLITSIITVLAGIGFVVPTQVFAADATIVFTGRPQISRASSGSFTAKIPYRVTTAGQVDIRFFAKVKGDSYNFDNPIYVVGGITEKPVGTYTYAVGYTPGSSSLGKTMEFIARDNNHTSVISSATTVFTTTDKAWNTADSKFFKQPVMVGKSGDVRLQEGDGAFYYGALTMPNIQLAYRRSTSSSWTYMPLSTTIAVSGGKNTVPWSSVQDKRYLGQSMDIVMKLDQTLSLEADKPYQFAFVDTSGNADIAQSLITTATFSADAVVRSGDSTNVVFTDPYVTGSTVNAQNIATKVSLPGASGILAAPQIRTIGLVYKKILPSAGTETAGTPNPSSVSLVPGGPAKEILFPFHAGINESYQVTFKSGTQSMVSYVSIDPTGYLSVSKTRPLVNGSTINTTNNTNNDITTNTNTNVDVTTNTDTNTDTTKDSQVSSIVKLRNPLKDGLDTIPKIVAAILQGIVLPIAVPLFAIMIIYSGILFVLAQGNPEKIKNAKNTLKWTLIGGAVILGAYVIAEAIQSTIATIVQK